jgi:hypothetical protein
MRAMGVRNEAVGNRQSAVAIGGRRSALSNQARCHG